MIHLLRGMGGIRGKVPNHFAKIIPSPKPQVELPQVPAVGLGFEHEISSKCP